MEASKRKGRQSAEVAENTRQTILEGAGRRFAAKGFAGTSLREIAEEAGTTHGLIRHHFGSKDDLWRAVVDAFINRMLTRQLPLIQRLDHDDPVSLLKGLATNYMRLSAEMPEVARLLVKDCGEPGPRLDHLLSRIRPIHSLIAPVFEQARATGCLHTHDNDSFFLFLVMAGTLPLALPDFANAFSSEDVHTRAGIEAHIDRVVASLFD